MITNIILFWWLPSFASVMLALYLSESDLSDILIKDVALLALLSLAGGWLVALIFIMLVCAESAEDPNTFWNKSIFKKKELDND